MMTEVTIVVVLIVGGLMLMFIIGQHLMIRRLERELDEALDDQYWPRERQQASRDPISEQQAIDRVVDPQANVITGEDWREVRDRLGREFSK